jgi:hypothetical protein
MPKPPQTAPASRPKRRTDAHDDAIAQLNTELAKVAGSIREMLKDPNSDVDKIAVLQGQQQALRTKIAARHDLRASAAKYDMRDDFIRERKAMMQLQGDLLGLLATRESDAQELDSLFTQVGRVLERLASKNVTAWRMFRELGAYITRGDPTTHRHDSLFGANQGRISTGGAGSAALVAALKGAGVGMRGIVETNALAALREYRADENRTIEEAMRDTNERVARHLAVAFEQKVDEVLAIDADEEEHAPGPAVLVDYSRPPAL